MYEERKKLSVRDIVIQLLLVVLFVFIMIWLFPTKGYLENNYAKNENLNEISDKLQALYGRLFADNVESMKDAGKDYFTTPRLPKNVGDSVTLTLSDMLDKKMVLPFKDSNNKSCDTTKSYIQLTKMDDEYQMKVQLTCSDYSDYIIVYMGCYNYCEGAICETKKPETPVTKPDKPVNPTPTEKKYKYEYAKDLANEYSAWTPWSNWTTNVINISDSNLMQVEKKTEKEMINDGSGWGIIDYKLVSYIEYVDKIVYVDKTVEVPNGRYDTISSTKLADSKDAAKVTTPGSSKWVTQANQRVTNKYLYSDSTTRYTKLSEDRIPSCAGCSYDIVRVYKVEKLVSSGGSTTYNCNAYPGYKLEGTKCNKYTTTTITVPLYDTIVTKVEEKQRVAETKYRWDPVYGNTNGTPTYRDVTYYRSRTRTQTQWAGRVTEWSTSNKDSNLINKGYYLTGKKEQV